MSAPSTGLDLARELAAICGSEHVCDDHALLTPFAIDGIRPAISVRPESAEEISAILKLANSHALTVVPAGGFTQQSFGNTPEQVDILLRTDRLNQIAHYDPGDLTIGVAAGMRVVEVKNNVAADGLMLPLDVPQVQNATIGGLLATASFGPLKHGFGSARDFCIGISFVTGDGIVVKAGGRVVKNVAGYDLMKLLIGSHGTLGVILSANFKLFPAPRQSRTFLAEFASLDDTLRFRDKVFNSPLSPICLELISPYAQRYLGADSTEDWTIAIRTSGSDAVQARYRSELRAAVCHEIDGDDESLFWRMVQDFSETVHGQHMNTLTMWLHMPPSFVKETLASAEKIATDNNFLLTTVGTPCTASFVLCLVPLLVDPPSAMQFANAISAIRGALPPDSAAIVTKCPREVKAHIDVWGSSSNDLNAMRTVKGALDPKGILNRGRFLF